MIDEDGNVVFKPDVPQAINCSYRNLLLPFSTDRLVETRPGMKDPITVKIGTMRVQTLLEKTEKTSLETLIGAGPRSMTKKNVVREVIFHEVKVEQTVGNRPEQIRQGDRCCLFEL